MRKIKNPTLILGLGGSGFLIAAKIKNLVKECFGGKIPESIQFLCLDFDRPESNRIKYETFFRGEECSMEASGNLSKEWLKISGRRNADYRSYISAIISKDANNYFDNTAQKEKLLEYLGNIDLSSGAGQKRILGKIGLAYPENYDTIYETLKQTITFLEKSNFDNVDNWDKISIYIINSLSGGTGSGTFLDIIFMLNHLDIKGREPEIFTFNLLPDVFLSSMSDNIFPELIKSNAFGAITELDYIYENRDNFTPTNFKETLKQTGLRQILPKANFLINERCYNGSKISYKSMLYTCARLVTSLSTSGTSIESEWSNFQTRISGDERGKNRVFCSAGYCEIIFNYERLEKYALAYISQKLLGTSPQEVSTNILQEYDPIDLDIILQNPEHYFFPNQTPYKEELEKIIPPKVKITKGVTITNDIENSKAAFEHEIKNLVTKYFDGNKLKNKIAHTIRQIKNSSENTQEVQQKIAQYTANLKNCTLRTENDPVYQKNLASFNENYEELKKAIEEGSYGRRRPWYSFLSRPSEDEKNNANRIIQKISDLFKFAYLPLVEKELLYKAVNNILITEAEEKKESIKSNVSEKDELEKMLKEGIYILDKKNEDNVIFLESFYREILNRLIEEDTNLNKTTYDELLMSNEKAVDFLKNTIAMRNVVTHLKNQTFANLKALLKKEDSLRDLENRIQELSNPLWDRASYSEINNGSPGSQLNLITFNRVELPSSEKDTLDDYFGKDAFSHKNGDVIITDHEENRQAFIKLELGLPAYLVNNIKNYKKIFWEEILNSEEKKKAINFFTYSEIRHACINKTFSIDPKSHFAKQSS